MHIETDSLFRFVKETIVYTDMEGDIKVKKVAQDVLLHVCFKRGFIEEKPSPDLSFIPEISNNLVENLCAVVWVRSKLYDNRFGSFFTKHFNRMTSSPKLFTKYVSYASYEVNEGTDAYNRFIDILTVMLYFSVHCWESGRTEFLNACVELFCAFFEKELRTMFEEQGGLPRFNEYLEKKFYLTKSKSPIRYGKDMFKYFENPKNNHETFFLEEYQKHSSNLMKVRWIELEKDEKTASFAKSVTHTVRELCKQTFDQILIEFTKTESRIQELYRKSTAESPDAWESKMEQLSLQEAQEEILESIPSDTNFEEKVPERKTVTPSETQVTRNSDNIYSLSGDTQDSSSLYISPKSNKLEAVKNMDGADVTSVLQSEMETDQEIFSKKESVADKMRELPKKTFNKILTEKVTMNSQLEGCFKSIGEASYVTVGTAEEFSLQQAQEVLGNISSNVKFDENDPESESITVSNSQATRKSGNINFQNVDTSGTTLSHLSLKSEKAKNLLDSMSMDISMLSGLIRSLCEQHGVQVGKPMSN